VDFSVSSAALGDRMIVTAHGELDAHSAPLLQAKLDPLTAAPGSSVVIDLSDVGFIDSTGLGVLVSTLTHVREVGGRLDVVVSAPRVLKVFTITGLNAVLALHATLDEALGAE
jgi:anti-sigma B factor antagonist